VRAQEAEGVLTTELASEVSRAKTAEVSNSAATASEVVRAKAAESGLSIDLTAEASRAVEAEGSLASDIATEAARASAEESALKAISAAEVSRATSAEDALATDIATESTRATAAEGALSSRLSPLEENALLGEKGVYTFNETVMVQQYVQFVNWRIGEDEKNGRLIFQHKNAETEEWSTAIPFIASA